jgi:hypothetical protein
VFNTTFNNISVILWQSVLWVTVLGVDEVTKVSDSIRYISFFVDALYLCIMFHFLII